MKFIIDNKYIEEGLVAVREHPTEPYLIYNYTPACQFSKAWDEVTIQCRGLVVHKNTHEIIARPFSKFFNYEEHVEKGLPIPDEKPLVYDKRDGSLGILYWGTDGTPYIATRGSFESDQAKWATKWFRNHSDFIDFDKKYTYLFEIIYPENRIVIDYGAYCGLDLLAVIDTETGEDADIVFPIKTELGTPIVPLEFTSYEDLKSRNEKNKEGFILHFKKSRLRLKIKFEDYVRLHKVLTGLSAIGIWEALSEEKEIGVENVPDEFFDWFRETQSKLKDDFLRIEKAAQELLESVQMLEDRKSKAEHIFKDGQRLSSIVFSMMDNKNYKKAIWRMVRPKGLQTFRQDIDA